MLKNFPVAALAAALLAAFPGAARAGTATATGTAALAVIDSCSVTGATVNLGTYKTSDTWYDVAVAHGLTASSAGPYSSGFLGHESLNFGSVTCAAGVPYNLTIKGTSPFFPGAIGFLVPRVGFFGGTPVIFVPAIKRLGGVVLPDSSTIFPEVGAMNVGSSGISASGTGSAQPLLGNVTYLRQNMPILEPLWLGSYSDVLTYTLTF